MYVWQVYLATHDGPSKIYVFLEWISYLHLEFSHWPDNDIIVSFTVNRTTLEARSFFRRMIERSRNKWNEEQGNADENGMCDGTEISILICRYEFFISSSLERHQFQFRMTNGWMWWRNGTHSLRFCSMFSMLLNNFSSISFASLLGLSLCKHPTQKYTIINDVDQQMDFLFPLLFIFNSLRSELPLFNLQTVGVTEKNFFVEFCATFSLRWCEHCSQD